MLLAIDVGNTNIDFGVYQGEKLLVRWRISTDRRKTADELGIILRGFFDYEGLKTQEVTGIVISSVVPPLMSALTTMAQKYFRVNPLVVEPGIKTGMPIRYENPREVGADRIVNGVAAYALYHGPVIVVDFGTATTFDVVSAQGEYLGGAIAPGIGISTEALFQRAAKLPRIDIVKPKGVIGKNTVASMQAGIYYGFTGQVDGIVTAMKEELKSDAFVVATGGLAELIASDARTINVVNTFLALEGLRIIFHRNR